MTTFWLSFTDLEATADKRFLGVAIFDMDESAGELSTTEIIKHAGALGVNPGGAVSVQEVGSIPDEHKNKLITDDARAARSPAPSLRIGYPGSAFHGPGTGRQPAVESAAPLSRHHPHDARGSGSGFGAAPRSEFAFQRQPCAR